MNRILIFLMVIFLISCDKEETSLIPNANPIDHYSLEISVLDCAMEQCLNPTVATDTEVKIYTQLQDAIDETNQLDNRSTDDEGSIFINIQAYHSVFLRVDHPTDGVYISNKITLSQSTITKHEIIFRGNLIYNYDHIVQKRQDHISFTYPTIGQVSNYKYYLKASEITIAPADEYENIDLQVMIIDQIGPNSYVIEETLDTLDSKLQILHN